MDPLNSRSLKHCFVDIIIEKYLQVYDPLKSRSLEHCFVDIIMEKYLQVYDLATIRGSN